MPIHSFASAVDNVSLDTLFAGALGVLGIVTLKAYTGGRKSTGEREWAGKMIIVVASPTPVILALLEGLLRLPSPPQVLFLPPYPSPLPDDLLTILHTLRLGIRNPLAQLHCEPLPRTKTAVRDFARKWASVEQGQAGEGGRRLDAIVLGSGWEVQDPSTSQHDASRPLSSDEWTTQQLHFHLMTSLLPQLLAQPAERNIRIVSLVAPSWSAAIPTLHGVKRKRTGSLQEAGHKGVETILLMNHFQLILDTLASNRVGLSKEVPEADGTIKKRDESVKSNIMGINVIMPWSRSEVVRPTLGVEENWLLWILYIALFPLVVLLTPSPNRAVQSVMFALSAPVRYLQPAVSKQPAGLAAKLDALEENRTGVQGGDTIRDCAVVHAAPSSPHTVPSRREVTSDMLGVIWATLILSRPAFAGVCAAKNHPTSMTSKSVTASKTTSAVTSHVTSTSLKATSSSTPLLSSRSLGLTSKSSATIVKPSVKAVTVLGDAGSSSDVSRDGFAGGQVNGKNVFLFCDSETSSTFVSNTAAYFNPSTPLTVTDFYVGSPSNVSLAIPFTSEEIQENKQRWDNAASGGSKQRIALWPDQGLVPTSGNQAIIFPSLAEVDVSSLGAVTYKSLYNTLVTLTVGDEPVAERTVGQLFAADQLAFGSYAAIRLHNDDGNVYLFAELTSGGLAMARVPLASVAKLSTYSYYLPSSKTWSSSLPDDDPSLNILPDKDNTGSGTMFWSTTHQTYALVYISNLDSTFRFRYSLDGTLYNWSANTDFYKAEAGSFPCYAGQAFPGFLGTDEMELLLGWTYVDDSGAYKNRLAKLEWA